MNTKIEKKLSIHSKKQYINIFLSLIEDVNDKKYMKELTYFGQFSFIYNDKIDIKLNLSYAFDEFVFDQIVTIWFQVHPLNFQIVKKLDAKFKYIFKLISIYLV